MDIETASKSRYFVTVVAVGVGGLALPSLLKMLSEFTEKSTHTVETTKLSENCFEELETFIFSSHFLIFARFSAVDMN